jgi:heat shock protein HslJ
MDNPEQNEIQLTIHADQFSVAPGGSLEIPLVLANPGSLPDQIRIGIEGIPLVWVSIEQPVLLLQPGDQRQIILNIQPPAPPNTHTGRYTLRFSAASTIDPARIAVVQVTLTVAGYEVKGRVGVLLDGLQYNVTPGEQLTIPVVLINQGLGEDTFRLSAADLPDGWVTIPVPALRLEPGEMKESVLIVQPPRQPGSRASRRPFRILVASQEAPDQGASIDCTLTVAAFVEFKSSLEPAQPDQNLPAQVLIQNISNVPVTFQVAWKSPEDSLAFEPAEPEPINLPSGETAKLAYTAQPVRRPLVGNAKEYPYTVTVQTSNQQPQTLEASLSARGFVPVWAAAAVVGILLLCCLCLAGSTLIPRIFQAQPATQTPSATATTTLLATTATPLFTSTATVPLPTATQSQVDQSPLLVGRNWYLVAFNDTHSLPGVQEPFLLFNPNGTLIGYTGCKNLSASYQTNFNQISVTNINLSTGACPDAALQQQEDMTVAILRSARSYFVADTALQITGDAGFLNYSLTQANRPDEILPPQPVIQAVPQAQTGQVVVFDGSSSSGQVPIVSWRWDFGDGSVASGVVVQHVFRNPGTFTVRLTVSDQRGQSGSVTQQIHILAPPTPTAPPPTLPPPTQAPTLPPPTLPPALPTPTPEPPPPPPTATPEPLPEPEPPQANASGPGTGFVGEPVTFDASGSRPGSSPIVSYNWTFGNGQVSPASPDPGVSIIYNNTGDYEVTVFVTDANGLTSYNSTRINISARLDTAVWTLASINGQPLLPGTAITTQFLNGQLTGFAGCNTYNGTFTATANGDGTYAVVIESLSSGRQSCPPDIMTQEANYLAALQQTNLAAIQENMATMSSPASALVFYLIGPQVSPR